MLVWGVLCQLSHVPGLNLLFSLPQNEGVGKDQMKEQQTGDCFGTVPGCWLVMPMVRSQSVIHKSAFFLSWVFAVLHLPCSRLGFGAHSFSSDQVWRLPSLWSGSPDSTHKLRLDSHRGRARPGSANWSLVWSFLGAYRDPLGQCVEETGAA